MKKLEKFADLKISEVEMSSERGGVAISESGTMYGSKWTFSGDLSLTQQLTVLGAIFYTDDYIGVASMDGNRKSGSWQSGL